MNQKNTTSMVSRASQQGSSLSCNLSLNNNTISRNCYNPFLRQRWIFQKLLQGIKCCVVNSSCGIVEKEKRNKPKGSSYMISCLSGYTLVVYRGKTISDESFLMSKSSWQTWSKKYKIKSRYLFLKSVGRECPPKWSCQTINCEWNKPFTTGFYMVYKHILLAMKNS